MTNLVSPFLLLALGLTQFILRIQNNQGLLVVQKATDTQNQQLVCIVQPSAQALLQPQSKDVFLQIHNSLGSGTAELSPTLVDVEQSKKPFAVYENYRYPFETTNVTEEQAWSILGYILPSIAINAVPFQTCLHREDLCLIEDGSLRLSPKGILYMDVVTYTLSYTEP